MSHLHDSVTNPQIFGPGMWAVLHTAAAHARTEEKKRSVLWLIWLLAANLKCDKCRRHFNQFIAKYSPDEFTTKDLVTPSGVVIPGLYVWTYKAHAAVESFTGKHIPPLEETFELWGNSDVGVCYGDCTSAVSGSSSSAPDVLNRPTDATLPRQKVDTMSQPVYRVDTDDAMVRISQTGFTFNERGNGTVNKMVPRKRR